MEGVRHDFPCEAREPKKTSFHPLYEDQAALWILSQGCKGIKTWGCALRASDGLRTPCGTFHPDLLREREASPGVRPTLVGGEAAGRWRLTEEREREQRTRSR